MNRPDRKLRTFRYAFPFTIPVLAGYLFLGIAFGILLASKGYPVTWALLMSVLIYAGSMQFAAIALLTAAFDPLLALIMTLLVNARHLFYGISMLEKYGDTGKMKPYLIFGLTDETFSILCSVDPPPAIDRRWFYFFVTLLDHSYWIAGSVAGAAVGSLVAFNTAGIDFVMTALFVVIFLDQLKGQKNIVPAVIGIAAPAFCLVLFGADGFMIPSMIAIVALLAVFRSPIERRCGP